MPHSRSASEPPPRYVLHGPAVEPLLEQLQLVAVTMRLEKCNLCVEDNKFTISKDSATHSLGDSPTASTFLGPRPAQIRWRRSPLGCGWGRGSTLNLRWEWASSNRLSSEDPFGAARRLIAGAPEPCGDRWRCPSGRRVSTAGPVGEGSMNSPGVVGPC